jgi:putative resolvase
VVAHRNPAGARQINARPTTGVPISTVRSPGCTLVVLHPAEVDDDLVRDMTGVLTSFCARLYGRRAARHRAEKALRCAARDVGPMALVQEASVTEPS